MIDPKIIKIILILVGSGTIGSILAMIPVLFGTNKQDVGYGTTAGVGFLIGASLGGLFGVFAVLLGQV